MITDQPVYPIQFSVDYPEGPLNRLTTFFRVITMIPIVVVVELVSEGGILFLPSLLMILFQLDELGIALWKRTRATRNQVSAELPPGIPSRTHCTS